jgi:hypothetical protein
MKKGQRSGMALAYDKVARMERSGIREAPRLTSRIPPFGLHPGYLG